MIAVPKSDGSIRLCIDARKLNAITKKNVYPQMNIDRIMSRIGSAKFFSSIDLKDAFYQIALSEHDREKTAFAVHGMGIFRYKRMPMGLVNSAATLCELVESVFNIESEPEVFVYLDDFIIVTDDFNRHIQVLEIVANKLRDIGLAIGIKKSKFCTKRLKFLGHIFSESGVEIDPERTIAINAIMRPTTVKQIRSFLGAAAWHKKIIENYSDLSAPLTDLTKKSNAFIWTDEHEKAFTELKRRVINAPILALPMRGKPFFIECTSSDIAISSMIYQMDESGRKVISYLSAKLTEAQKKFHVIEKKCLSVIIALEKFRIYFHGNPVTVIADDGSLTWLKNCKDPTGRMARWSLRLQSYDFELRHKQYSSSAIVSLLCNHVNIDSLEEVDFEIESYEMLSVAHEISPMQTSNGVTDGSGCEIIDITPSKEVQDEWYRKKFATTVGGETSDYFNMENDILYTRFDKLKKPFDKEWKICVPLEDRQNVLEEEHNSILASHPGFARTLKRVQENYYWPKMYQTVDEFVRNCEICHTCKSSNVNTHTPMGQRRETDMPFRTLSADFVGPMTRSKSQNQYLFVVVDNFSKFAFLLPMREAKANKIIDFIEKHIFLNFGVPEQFVCDNGVQFASKDLRAFMSRYKVQLRFTPLYHPQANPCEIANKAIVNAIRTFVVQQENQKTWDEKIPHIAHALNSTVHLSTDLSPFHIVLGRNPTTSGEDFKKIVDMNASKAIDEDTRANILNFVRENLYKSYLKSMENHKRRAVTRDLNLKKKAYLVNQKLSNASEGYSKKLGRKYVPIRIKKKVGTDTYLVENEEGKELGVFHAKLIVQY